MNIIKLFTVLPFPYVLTIIYSSSGHPTSIGNGKSVAQFNRGKYPPIGPGTDAGMHLAGQYEGDILITDNTNKVLKNAVSDEGILWLDAAIIYRVDDDIGCPESPQCELLMKAMDHYHLKSCVRFKEWSGERNYIQIFFNKNNSGACYSAVGRSGDGEQLLSLGQRCWYFGIIVHELGHAIGFWHEMNRPDRDDWIVVYWKNIIKGFRVAFKKNDPKSVLTLGEQFDYKSIMMYDEYAFSKDGKVPTLQAKTGQIIGPIWKKKGLSKSDVTRLHKLYNCEGNKQKVTFPHDVSCSFNNNNCGFKNDGAAVWNWRIVNETDGYMYATWEVAGTTPGYLTSINFHPISNHDKSRGPVGCVRFWYLLQGDSVAFLKLIFQSQFDENATFGTIALDDVEILYRDCGEPSAIQTELKPIKPLPTTTTTETVDTEEPEELLIIDDQFSTVETPDSTLLPVTLTEGVIQSTDFR